MKQFGHHTVPSASAFKPTWNNAYQIWFWFQGHKTSAQHSAVPTCFCHWFGSSTALYALPHYIHVDSVQIGAFAPPFPVKLGLCCWWPVKSKQKMMINEKCFWFTFEVQHVSTQQSKSCDGLFPSSKLHCQFKGLTPAVLSANRNGCSSLFIGVHLRPRNLLDHFRHVDLVQCPPQKGSSPASRWRQERGHSMWELPGVTGMGLAAIIKEHKIARTNQDIVTCHVIVTLAKEPRGNIPMVELIVFPGGGFTEKLFLVSTSGGMAMGKTRRAFS